MPARRVPQPPRGRARERCRRPRVPSACGGGALAAEAAGAGSGAAGAGCGVAGADSGGAWNDAGRHGGGRCGDGGRRSRCGRSGRRRRGIRDARGRHAADLEAALEAVEPRGVARLARGAGQQDAGGDELELEPRRGGAGHLGEPGVDDVGRTGERAGPERRGLAPHPLELVLGHVPQHLAGTVGQRGDDDEVAQPLEEVLDEAARVEAGLDDLVDRPEDRSSVARREGVDRGVEQLTVGEAEQGRGRLVGQAVGPGARDELVEHGQRVTHRAPTRTHDEGEHAGGDRDALLDAELLHVRLQPGRRDEAERVVVGARADGADDLLGLGGREDELHVLGRLLDDLEQGVEALRRDHVRLVDDVDLVAALCRAVRGPFAQVTGVVDTTVARGVDLDHVDRAGAAPRQRDARVAGAARLRGGAGLAVQAARQDAGAGGLPAATGAAEQVGVVDPPGAQRLHERLGHVLLPDDVDERLGPVAAVQGGAHGPNSSRDTGHRARRTSHCGRRLAVGGRAGPVGSPR